MAEILISEYLGGLRDLAELVLACFIPRKSDRRRLEQIIESGALFLWETHQTCPYTICDIAAKTGSVEAIKLLFDHGYHLKYYSADIGWTAATEGHLSLLTWISTEQPDLMPNFVVLYQCMRKRSFEVFKYLWPRFAAHVDNSTIIQQAALYGIRPLSRVFSVVYGAEFHPKQQSFAWCLRLAFGGVHKCVAEAIDPVVRKSIWLVLCYRGD